MENKIFNQHPDLEPVIKALVKALNPQHILLFGTTIGGTQHSESQIFDILVITPEAPRYNDSDIRRYIKQNIPNNNNVMAKTNIYAYSQNFNANVPSPLLYHAKKEGEILYSIDNQLLARPKTKLNYAEAYRNTTTYFNTFFDMGTAFLKDARRHFEDGNLRQAAFYTSNAALLFLRVQYFVYHGFATECNDMALLRQRMRTLSFDLNTIFDSDDNNNGRLTHLFKLFINDSFNSVSIDIIKEDVAFCLGSAEKIREVIEVICRLRLDSYKARI